MTMTEEDFISRSVAHQIGVTDGIAFSTDIEARRYAEARCSGMTVGWNVEAAAPHPLNGWAGKAKMIQRYLSQEPSHGSHDKSLDSLREILHSGAHGSILIDMQDRRVRSVISPEKRGHPVFCFNRLSNEPGRILWPLPGYHGVKSDGFLGNLDPARIAWPDKADKFAWRGIVGGRANPHLDARREKERLRPLLRKVKTGSLDVRRAQARLLTFPRFRFVDCYQDHVRADIGFVDGNGFILRSEHLLKRYERPRIPREAFQQFKYLVVLRGLDVGSSFYWTMNSGSLGLVMETPFESFASIHFEPWVHYVPFKEDLSDFEENFAWCQSHQDECQAMTRSAAEVCKLLARPDLRAEILRRVVAEVNRLTGQ
jgi:hypothetical protein